jgi:hypothetical protein
MDCQDRESSLIKEVSVLKNNDTQNNSHLNTSNFLNHGSILQREIGALDYKLSEVFQDTGAINYMIRNLNELLTARMEDIEATQKFRI